MNAILVQNTCPEIVNKVWFIDQNLLDPEGKLLANSVWFKQYAQSRRRVGSHMWIVALLFYIKMTLYIHVLNIIAFIQSGIACLNLVVSC